MSHNLLGKNGVIVDPDNVIVSLAGCRDYERTRVREAVAGALELCGGAESIVAPGRTVFIKANNVIAAEPDSGVVTHPEVVRAVVEEFRGVAGRIIVGDCPGGPFTQAMLKRVYARTGLARVAQETGCELAIDTGTIEVNLPSGKMVKRVTLSRAMVEAGALISVSKFKTHRFMNVTGPVKNLFGAVPGLTKFVYHSRFEDERDFADLVLDVHLAARPAFHLADAVEVMQGEGARNGVRRQMGLIAASANALALESLVLRTAGLETADSRPLAAAVARGVCPPGAGWFEVAGENPETFTLDDFQLPERNFFSERLPARLTGRVTRKFLPLPGARPDTCTGCGTCVDICPRGAMSIERGVARADPRACIRCFCCQELCEQGAIVPVTPRLGRLFRL